MLFLFELIYCFKFFFQFTAEIIFPTARKKLTAELLAHGNFEISGSGRGKWA
jgi:hypothetical protein